VVVDTLATDNGGLERALLKGLQIGAESAKMSDPLGELLACSEVTVMDNGVLSAESSHDRLTIADLASAYKDAKDTLTAIDQTIKSGSADEKQAATASRVGAAKAVNDLHVQAYLSDIIDKKTNNLDTSEVTKLGSKKLSKKQTKIVLKYARKTDDVKKSHSGKVHKKDRIFNMNKDIVRPATSLSDSHKDLLIPNAIQRTISITVETTMEKPGTDGVYHSITFQIPVTIKLAVIFTDTDNIINAISTQSDKFAFGNRLDDYRAGAISMADFIFAGDLIEKYKSKKFKDKDNLMNLLRSRELSANSKIISNGFAGFEKFYNMYIISPETRKAIEAEVGSPLKAKGKDLFLERGLGLSVTTVDPDYERVAMMFKDIRGHTDLSFRNATKKDSKGSDYSEIIKALMANKPPVF